MKNIIVTGGAGFIGSNFVGYFLENYKDFNVINYDKLTYAGNPDNLKDVEGNPRYKFVKGDICDKEKFTQVLNEYRPDYIVNFAAESHVDRSISGSQVFVETNVLGTHNLLECAKKFWNGEYKDKRFLQVSTDEVYGSLDNYVDVFTEDSNLLPNSPYAASKAGADLIARSFFRTYGFPVIITRCSNNYGPYQHKEKFIPICISRALKDLAIPIYGDGTYVREWIHVLDHCSGIVQALFYGTPGEIYNIGSGEETSNVLMAKMILNILGKSEDSIFYTDDRPGHDKRYALDSTKTRESLNWSCKYNLKEGIRETVEWYKNHRSWLDK